MLILYNKVSLVARDATSPVQSRIGNILEILLKKLAICFLLLINYETGLAQTSFIDSLHSELTKTENDSLRIKLYASLSEAFKELQPDSCVYFSRLLGDLAEKHGFRLKQAYALGQIGYALKDKGEFPMAFRNLLAAKQICEDPTSESNIVSTRFMTDEGFQIHTADPHVLRLSELSITYLKLGVLYENMNDFKQEKEYQLLSRKYAQEAGSKALESTANSILGKVYLIMGETDSALEAEQNAYSQAISSNYNEHLGTILLNLGKVYAQKGDIQQAINYNKKAIAHSYEISYLRGVAAGNLALSDFFLNSGQLDSALHYGNLAQDISAALDNPGLMLRSYTAKAGVYRKLRKNDSIVKYQTLMIGLKDSLQNPKQIKLFENIAAEEEKRKQELENEKEAYAHKLQTVGLISLIVIFLIIAGGLWFNNKQRRKAFGILEKQKEETDIQKAKAEQALVDLKATQSQLVQREKMASLGELTAGIAHEIQNPLNFVNNFSEINGELIQELKNEIKDDHKNEASSLAETIAANEKKIIHHGRRADAIVKGMLQHSRAGTGVKQPTDLNALVDECLRLSYHGFLARDQHFNVTLVQDLDPEIKKLDIVPPDVSSVLLNLFNNAFYAVNKKMKKQMSIAGGNGSAIGYQPMVRVRTRGNSKPGYVEILIEDNGEGIPASIFDKIFQPFFTTKPTGEGTGLGLSLSYDVIKAHGGEIKVDSASGEGSTFTIEIPA
jgi:signal transduction histidine kinase